jgi:hypothetical protein
VKLRTQFGALLATPPTTFGPPPRPPLISSDCIDLVLVETGVPTMQGHGGGAEDTGREAPPI